MCKQSVMKTYEDWILYFFILKCKAENLNEDTAKQLEQ